MSQIFSRWTDEDLLYVLIHTNGDFTMALETIIRHEATGRPPAELIHLLRAGRRRVSKRSSSPQRRSRRLSDSYVGSVSVPSTSSTPLFQGEGIPFDIERQQQQNLSLPADSFDMFSLSWGAGPVTRTWAIPASSPSSTVVAANLSTHRTQQGMDMNQSLSESTQRHIDEVTTANARASEEESKHLNLQSGIEASLKETSNPSETDTDIDNEAMAYAVKVSKQTFEEEHRKQEVRNELEKRMIDISLAASLADPVKKSEEELIGVALRRSMADPIPKSEEQLIEQARTNSLDDMKTLEVIMKAEEELVEAVKLKSLHTMSKDEELIEAVKRQSLLSVSSSTGKKPATVYCYWQSNSDQRQSTSTTHALPLGLGLAKDDSSDCSRSSVEVEHPPPPSINDSSVANTFDMDLMDRKMPALALPVAQDQECNNDEKSSSSFGINPSPNPNVASTEDALSLASVTSDQDEDENRSGANAGTAHHKEDSRGSM